ncbi:MAG: riboflavin synthase [Gammaproteobacteria bacterium]|nr:riboflavin synthase [Gammaproteobacteria bacterium]
MFTGIIQSLGSIESIREQGGDIRLTVNLGDLDNSEISIGDSIAVNGVCLTVISDKQNRFCADVSLETLSRTTLGSLNSGSPVNLELALTPQSRMGGHFVSGHVDGIGTVKQRYPDARSERFEIKAPPELMRYIAEKGSICIEGVSLTVNTVSQDSFSVNLIPHTLDVTTIGQLQLNDTVNLEVDLLARYLERLMTATKTDNQGAHSITEDFLKQTGFIDQSQ